MRCFKYKKEFLTHLGLEKVRGGGQVYRTFSGHIIKKSMCLPYIAPSAEYSPQIDRWTAMLLP